MTDPWREAVANGLLFARRFALSVLSALFVS